MVPSATPMILLYGLSIGLALAGAGPWSLALGALAGNVVSAVVNGSSAAAAVVAGAAAHLRAGGLLALEVGELSELGIGECCTVDPHHAVAGRGVADSRVRSAEFDERGPIPKSALVASLKAVVEEAKRALAGADGSARGDHDLGGAALLGRTHRGSLAGAAVHQQGVGLLAQVEADEVGQARLIQAVRAEGGVHDMRIGHQAE